jgi:hypothetical protein
MLERSTMRVQASVVEPIKPKKARVREGIWAVSAVCADAELSRVGFI